MPAVMTERIVPCALCGTPGATLFQGLRDRLYSVEGEFGFARCAACGLVWQSPRPILADIPKCYPDDYEPHEGASQSDEAVRPAAGMRDALRAMILSEVFGYTRFKRSEWWASVAGRLQVGDEARIVLDAAPQYVVPARVSFVAAEAQFTPKYVETAAERDKLVYRVKLQVPREVAQRYSRYVKAGLTGYGHVRTDARTPWPASLQVRLPEVSEASPAASR